jgi:hypothetical protein
MKNSIAKLNCSVGDLAITVGSNIPENCGNIVRVESALGFDHWRGHAEPLFTWNVEIATAEGWLHYCFESGEMRKLKSGPVPDKYLRRLTPPKDYLIGEFSESEQLQMELYEQDCLEGVE